MKTRIGVLLATTIALIAALTGCAGSVGFATSPGAPQPAAVCIPTGDGEMDHLGQAYRCANSSIADGRSALVAYATDYDFVGKPPVTGWMDLRAFRMLPAEQVAGYDLDASGKKPRAIPRVAACLWDGALTCVSNSYPEGFTLVLDSPQDVTYKLPNPVGNATKPAGIPDRLTAEEAKAFLSSYAVWTYDSRMTKGPWPSA